MEAKEARKIANEALDYKEKQVIETINKDIMRTAKEKRYLVAYRGTFVTENIANHLRNKGFIVTYNKGNCIITW